MCLVSDRRTIEIARNENDLELTLIATRKIIAAAVILEQDKTAFNNTVTEMMSGSPTKKFEAYAFMQIDLKLK